MARPRPVARQALYERLLAAHSAFSTIDTAESAKRLTADLGKLERPKPCRGELAPEGREYGPGGMRAA